PEDSGARAKVETARRGRAGVAGETAREEERPDLRLEGVTRRSLCRGSRGAREAAAADGGQEEQAGERDSDAQTHEERTEPRRRGYRVGRPVRAAVASLSGEARDDRVRVAEGRDAVPER